MLYVMFIYLSVWLFILLFVHVISICAYCLLLLVVLLICLLTHSLRGWRTRSMSGLLLVFWNKNNNMKNVWWNTQNIYFDSCCCCASLDFVIMICSVTVLVFYYFCVLVSCYVLVSCQYSCAVLYDKWLCRVMRFMFLRNMICMCIYVYI